ncbi:MAG: transglutaminase domain-containing protein, partial [Verrucomicrobiae bacterium]|nr:transglutaminase domain-containing protein [Verrucomicrobiae bacterium]
MTNLPATSDEPYSMPDMHLGPYVILYYFNSEPKKERYWRDMGKELYSEAKKRMKPSRDIESFVETRTKGAVTVRDKLKMLYVYCQDEITNHDYSYNIYTAQELKDLPENFSPQDTFERGHGSPEDINNLFGSMARAMGLNAEIAKTNDIRTMLFTENSTYTFALPDQCAAVKIDDEWNFFNPGSPFLPFDSLTWWAAGSKALIGDAKEANLVMVPMQKADFSVLTRSGDFELDETGTLKGQVTIELNGFSDLDMKEDLARRHTDEEEQDWILHELKEHQPQAKASNFKIQNRSSLKPMRIEYDLEIPEFADVTGKRIFVQPAVFQKNAEPVFTSEKRKGDILFPYPWMEVDEISISIPQDFGL